MRFNYFATLVFTAVSATCMSRAADTAPITGDDMPARWLYTGQYEQTSPTADRWWRDFNDPMLDSLITLAVDNNYDIIAAQRRIEMAGQSIVKAQSQYYPTLSANAGWTAQRSSGVTTSQSMSATNLSFFNLGLDMAWQIDVFGRVRENVKGSRAEYRASRAEYDATMVTVAAKTATAYLQLRTLQAERAMLDEHIRQQKKVTDITEERHEAGLASMLDVTQARTVYYSTQAQITSINTSIATTINAIATLIGVYPEQLSQYLSAPASLPDYRRIVSVGVPMELLRRRPDIVQAESQMAVYAAALGVAEKDFLPALSLNGSVGTSAHAIGDMFTDRSFTYTVAPTLSWTIFDGKARSAAKASAKVQMQAGIDAYNQAVITAVQEVDNALATYSNSLQYIDMIEKVVETSKQSFDLSLDLYKQGLSAFINVENAQISYLQYSNELISAQGQALAALVTLYEALGGGWE